MEEKCHAFNIGRYSRSGECDRQRPPTVFRPAWPVRSDSLDPERSPYPTSAVVLSSASFGLNAFGDESPCKTTIYNWFSEFKCGRVILSDEFRDGRPSTVVNNDAVRRIV
ncbi:hypothetical protein EVAR_38802_1 [Eumeta japonica]|uniref:Mos1 transposase HTH domain-containing protein n=1 Tax=Eumeta variegata TaxID=151549 RepID=A0A4C1WJ15_EUMVA|nr:hypothetical protein EVAR_38802_1 [Eumeta japonica]